MIIGPRAQALILVLISILRTGHLNVDRPVLYAIYCYDIIVRLHRIHDHAERDGPKGALIVALHSRTPGYVTCRFADEGATLVCEAFAGVYPSKPGPAPPVSAATEEGLKKAGYWRDANGRALFRYELEPDGSDWGGAAVTILNSSDRRLRRLGGLKDRHHRTAGAGARSSGDPGGIAALLLEARCRRHLSPLIKSAWLAS
jgi:hypothetical protein